MIIYGREYKFFLTIGASVEIAELCPGGDIKRIGEVLNTEKPLGENIGVISGIVCALSKGAEVKKAFENVGYVPEPITKEISYSLDNNTYNELVSEAFAAYIGGKQTSVEVEPEPAKNAAAAVE